MLEGSIDVGPLLTAKDVKKLYQLTATEKKRLNRSLGRIAVKGTGKRIQTQTDVRGGKLAKRKTGNKKMLKGLKKGLVVYAKEGRATVTWKNNLMGSIAYKHHHGLAEKWTAAKMKRLFGEPDYSEPATREQARSLLAAGFKAKIDGRTKRPSQKWIMENLKIGQAGLLLRVLRDKAEKQSWLITLPKRQVLGASNEDISDMVQTIKNFISKK